VGSNPTPSARFRTKAQSTLVGWALLYPV